MVVVAIGTMALIIVLSVFNGLEGLLRNLYGTVDPNLVVSAAYGKSFEYPTSLKTSIQSLDGVQSITEVVEDNALIKYKEAQRVAKIKGVSESFIEEGRLVDAIALGDFQLKKGTTNFAILGRGIQYDLSVDVTNDFYPLQIYYPKNISPGAVGPEQIMKMVNTENILPGAVFAVEKSYDENYVFVPIDFAIKLFGYEGKRTSLEIELSPAFSVEEVKQNLQSTLGDGFLVQTNAEIHGDLYKILEIEKLFVFLIFSIIIAIASINIFFSLTMLAIDKKKDVAILSAQGASSKLIRNIFLYEGCIVAFSGAFVGLVLGLGISYFQQTFGVISMGMQTSILDAYPVKILPGDVLYTVLCIIVITIITSIQPALKASKNIELHQLQ
jgi:lipoprotein-releasing system permease protein